MNERTMRKIASTCGNVFPDPPTESELWTGSPEHPMRESCGLCGVPLFYHRKNGERVLFKQICPDCQNTDTRFPAALGLKYTLRGCPTCHADGWVAK